MMRARTVCSPGQSAGSLGRESKEDRRVKWVYETRKAKGLCGGRLEASPRKWQRPHPSCGCTGGRRGHVCGGNEHGF